VNAAFAAAAVVCVALSTAIAVRAQERIRLDDGWTFAIERDGARPPDDAFQPIRVPAPFEEFAGPTFDGVGWYRRTLTRPRHASADATLRVDFAAVATHATVFADGVEIGRHLGGWTPFRVTLPVSTDAGVRLDVRVDEKVGHNTQGFLPIVQPHFGGIWQPVHLCVDEGPVLDRIPLLTFGDVHRETVDGEGIPTLRVEATTVAPPPAGLRFRIRLTDGARVVVEQRVPVPSSGPARAAIEVPTARLWSPTAPHLYGCEIALLDADDVVLDRERRRVGFRDLVAHGRELRLNGDPLSVRGILHWGVAPGRLAPNPGVDVWRREFESMRARGFNLVKACLWLPPPEFFALADEIGLLVWQEYPTWHPKITPQHRDDLIAEYDEFHQRDRSHVSVAFRSLTCETGHGADFAIVKELYERTKCAVPQTLVVDDSSWITWHRIHDFYDDHPYGNHRDWPRRLAGFDAHIRAREAKPLLFGECITADTWVDRAALTAAIDGPTPWWAPRCLDDQANFETWLRDTHGAETLASLAPIARDYAMRSRKYQLERLRLDLPQAGYVVSVLRDFPLARMGLIDDLDRQKWSEDEFAWHRDVMLCLATKDDRRAFVEDAIDLNVVVSNFAAAPVRGTLVVTVEADDGGIPPLREEFAVEVSPGANGPPLAIRANLPPRPQPSRLTVRATLSGSHSATSQWSLWQLPDAPETPGLERERDAVRIVDRLDAPTLDWIEAGGNAVLRASDRKHSLRTRGQQYYRGAPFSPPHPLHELVPAQLLHELQHFDLEGPRVLEWELLRGQVDPILAMWDTHDIAKVESYLFAAETRIGAGRLLATTLDHDSDAGRWLMATFRQHLASGPAPRNALSDATRSQLRALLATKLLDVPDWQIRFDPSDRGLAEGIPSGTFGDGWSPIRAGSHWENQGHPQKDGIAWYRTEIAIPADFAGATTHIVFEGVDDSFVAWLDGTEIGRFGDPVTKTTVWQQRVSIDVTKVLRPGHTQPLVLRVVDHVGAGGLWRPVFLTTGPVDAASKLLH
jgi:hypothetical protein